MNSFSQFHSTFIRKHSRFFVRVGHKPQSIDYKVCTYMSSGNLSLFFSLSSSEKNIFEFFEKKYFKRLFVKMCQFLSALLMMLVGLVILLPCPYTSPKIFWASPKLWLHLVTLQKLLCWHKNQFYWMQIIFLSGTKCLWLPQYVNKFLVWHKTFGTCKRTSHYLRISIYFISNDFLVGLFYKIASYVDKIVPFKGVSYLYNLINSCTKLPIFWL